MRSSYLPLLRLPGARAFCLAALVGRMPISMLGIGSVLLVQDRRGSYALAGAVAAGLGLGLAVGGPRVSRLVDRHGQRAVLPWCLLVTAVGLVGLLLLSGSSAPGWTLVLPTLLAGTALPPLGSCVRARWTHAVHGRADAVGVAMALESVADELVFVLGPALVVVLATLLDPAVGLVTALALCAAGTLTFVGLRASEPPVQRAAGVRVPAIRSAGLRTAALCMVFVGLLFGALEVVMVAFAQERGQPSAAGFLLPLVAAGSALSGLVYGARTWRTPLERRFLVALAFLVVSVVPVVLAPGVGAMVPAALLAGLAVSPTLIVGFALAARLVPPSARTEGFTWLNSGIGVGAALGSAAAGALADAAGAGTAFLLCPAGALAALLVAVAGRRSLLPGLPLAVPSVRAAT
jgi:predicted MFS family arabinose efflux permease